MLDIRYCNIAEMLQRDISSKARIQEKKGTFRKYLVETLKNSQIRKEEQNQTIQIHTRYQIGGNKLE